jgi:hypothetical protein
LKEVLTTTDARLLHKAEATIDLLGKRLTTVEIAQAPESAHKISASLALLVEFCTHARPIDILDVTPE